MAEPSAQMLSLPPQTSALVAQQAAQRLLALDPKESIWVSASAGSGKTTLLTERVLRLLLQNRIEKSLKLPNILCLTYTKAGAAEMQNRVQQQLANWATLSESDLQYKLEKSFEIKTDTHILKKARRLFAEVLDKPEALRIMTMHAFCQMILNRFPHEAGLAPHFTLLEGENEKRFQDNVLAQFYAQLVASPDLSAALGVLGRYQSTTQTRDMLKSVFQNTGKWARHFAKYANEQAFCYDLAKKLTPVFMGSEEEYLAAQCGAQHVPEADLRQAIEVLSKSITTDKKAAQVIADWLAQPEKRAANFSKYTRVFVTEKDELRKPCAAEITKKSPHIAEIIIREGSRVQYVHQQALIIRYYHQQCAFYRLSKHLWTMAQAAKQRHAQLTYDDLILKARDVLRAENIAPWMLYKLDGGIDHILIDEAQDTSPEQWDIITTLLDDMLSGQGARSEQNRTLFVVGDEKQSIYSFQGADHRNYLHVKMMLMQRFENIEKKLHDMPRIQSFRSTSAVLEFVDTVFEQADVQDGVSQMPIRHFAHRAPRGYVEMWSPITTDAKKDITPWFAPLERETITHAYIQLAGRIADSIQTWLTAGWHIKDEMAQGGTRAIRPDDIIILLQRRSDLLAPIIRALKERNVPVAGIDRMVLHEQAAVQDVLALCRFLLLPQDDLVLAEVLRGPFIRITDEQLFTIAHARKGTLWEALQANVDFNTTCEYLKSFLNKVDRISAFEFLTRIFFLPCPGNTKSGKAALLHRLGADALDPLEQMLSAARSFDVQNPISLQLFVRSIANDDSELKREQSSANGEVRIMTTHSAKGLEAKIVFVPDLMRDPNKSGNRQNLIWGQDNVPVILPTGVGHIPFVDNYKMQLKEAQAQENRRLLYVALTRAADVLILCSAIKNKETDRTPWRNHCEAAMQALGADITENQSSPVWQFGDAQTLMKSEHISAADTKTAPEKPLWLTQPIVKSIGAVQIYNPSTLILNKEKQIAAGSNTSSSFQRGKLLHRLLQLLPEIPTHDQEASALRFLTRNSTADENEIMRDVAEVMAVLRHPVFAHVFSKDAHAELPIIGTVMGKRFSGQIDRLWASDNEVRVIDFKTNRPPPAHIDDVDDAYLAQMACYRLLLEQIYPHKTIRAGLLWTYTLTLMQLDDAAHHRGVAILQGLGASTAIDPTKSITI